MTLYMLAIGPKKKTQNLTSFTTILTTLLFKANDIDFFHYNVLIYQEFVNQLLMQ